MSELTSGKESFPEKEGSKPKQLDAVQPCHGSQAKGAIVTITRNLHSHYLPDIPNFNSILDPMDNRGDLSKT